jgi:hypothetical protein
MFFIEKGERSKFSKRLPIEYVPGCLGLPQITLLGITIDALSDLNKMPDLTCNILQYDSESILDSNNSSKEPYKQHLRFPPLPDIFNKSTPLPYYFITGDIQGKLDSPQDIPRTPLIVFFGTLPRNASAIIIH